MKEGMTVHSGLNLHPAGLIFYEVYRDASQSLYLRLETLKKSTPIPILLYNGDGGHKQLMLEDMLELSLLDLGRGSYEVRSAVGEIFRFVVD